MSKPTSSKPCLTCGGRGTISSGPDDLKCEACSGTGKQK